MNWTWLEIDDAALEANVRVFRERVGNDLILAVNVKGNGYGHGLLETARAFIDGGANWLCIQTVNEGIELRSAGIMVPLHIVGPVALNDFEIVSKLNMSMVVYNEESLATLEANALPIRLHIKVETGNHRQGVPPNQAIAMAERIRRTPGLVLEGICSHFANIEDTTDHRYARHQQSVFAETIERLAQKGHTDLIRHLSNSASAILWPDQGFELVRIGIGAYGHWPSPETKVAAHLVGAKHPTLKAALTWKTRIAQVKAVPKGAFVGYGCTYMTTRETRLAVLPIGYYDGYDRALSNVGHVLCHGARAPIRGRVCMNMTMVDITDIPEAKLHDEVVLIGCDEEEEISAEQLAQWQGSINYEVLARIGSHLPRQRVRRPVQPSPTNMTYRRPQKPQR